MVLIYLVWMDSMYPATRTIHNYKTYVNGMILTEGQRLSIYTYTLSLLLT